GRGGECESTPPPHQTTIIITSSTGMSTFFYVIRLYFLAPFFRPVPTRPGGGYGRSMTTGWSVLTTAVSPDWSGSAYRSGTGTHSRAAGFGIAGGPFIFRPTDSAGPPRLAGGAAACAPA